MSGRRWSESKFGSLIQSKKQKDHFASSDGLKDERMEMILWFNHILTSAGYQMYAISDVTRDLSDGIVLIKLLQAIIGERIHCHSPASSHRMKSENLQTVFSIINQRGISITGITSEDIIRGNLKAVLNLCSKVQQLTATLRGGMGTAPSPEMTGPFPSPLPGGGAVQRNDPLLMWAGNILQRDVKDYSEFRDGRYFCEIIAILYPGLIDPSAIVPNISPQSCLTNVVQIAEEHLGVRTGPFDVIQVTKGENDAIIQLFLQQLRSVKPRTYESSSLRRGSTSNMDSSHSTSSGYIHDNNKGVIGRNEQMPSWMRGPSLSQMSTPEYYRQQTVARHSVDTSNRESSNPQFTNSRSEFGGGGEQPRRMKFSYSTDHLNTSSSGVGSQFNSSNSSRLAKPQQGHYPVDPPVDSVSSRGSYQLPDSRMNRSSSTTQFNSSHANINPSNYSTSTSRPFERNHNGGGTGMIERPHSRHTTPTSVEYSYSNDLPMPVTIYRTASRTSISSRGSVEAVRGSVDEGGSAYAPEYQTEKYSLRRSNMGGSLGNISSTLSGEQLTQSYNDAGKLIAELSETLVRERNSMARAIARERKKRCMLEEDFKKYKKSTQDAVRHYEACVLYLGKEVSKLTTELRQVKGRLARVDSFEQDIQRLSAEVSAKVELRQQQDQYQQNQYPYAPVVVPQELTSSNQNKPDQQQQPTKTEKSRKSMFSKKKS